MAAASTPTQPSRRTNAERTAETRAKLLDATAACLAELGYARTSTTEICRRAGVSRGAQLHHFPTKADLVAAAVDHVVRRRAEEVRAILMTMPQGQARLDVAIDVLWGMAQGPSFEAWFELVTASRTDPELQPVVADMADRLADTIRRIWAEFFPLPDGAGELAVVYDTVPSFFFTILDGLAVRRMAGGQGQPREQDEVLGLVRVLAGLLPALVERPDLRAALTALVVPSEPATPQEP